MLNHPYPYHGLTREDMEKLVQRAHQERAEAVRDLIAALIRRKPQAAKAGPQPSLSATQCH